MKIDWLCLFSSALSIAAATKNEKQTPSDTQNIQKPLTILVSHQMGSRSHVKYVFDILYPLQEEGHKIIYATTSNNIEFSKAYNYTTVNLGPDPLTIEDFNYIRETNTYKQNYLIEAHVLNGILPIYFNDKLSSYKPIFNEYNIDLMICDFFSPSCVDAGLNQGLPVIVTAHGLPLSDYNLPHFPLDHFNPKFYKLNVFQKFIHRYIHPYLFHQAVQSGTDKMNSARIQNNMTTASNFFGHMDKALYLSNSFFDWEFPKSLPPNIQMIGPIDTPPKFIANLTEDLELFLDNHTNVMMIGFGTHLILSSDQMDKIFTTILTSLEEDLIDGVVWSLGHVSEYKIPETVIINQVEYRSDELMSKYDRDIVMKPSVPQYSLLKRSEVKLLVSHGGMESLYESFFTATPTLVIPFSVDQPKNAKRIQELNLGDYLVLDEVDSNDIVAKIRSILQDRNKEIQLNRLKFQMLTNFNAQKVSAVRQLIKNYAYTHQLCTQNQAKGWRDTICELKSYLPQEHSIGLLEANKFDIYILITGSLLLSLGLMYVFGMLIYNFTNQQSNQKTKNE